jgi:hypothetical protein
MSITIADGKRIFKGCVRFFIVISSTSGIEKHARLCMQFADSGGNIAAGALSRTKTLSICTLRIFLLFLEMSTKVRY